MVLRKQDSFMLSFGATSVDSCQYFDIVSCSETSLMLLLSRWVIDDQEGGAGENVLSAMVDV